MKTKYINSVALSVLAAAACASDLSPPPTMGMQADGGSTVDASSPPKPGDLPLLPAGEHAGMIVGFNAFHPVTTAIQIDARWQEAVDKGMKIGRIQVDWGEIEATAGQLDMSGIVEPLEVLAADGLLPYVSIGTYEALTETDTFVPADLQSRLLTGEIGWDHPDVIARFHSFLDKIVPEVEKHKGWVISLGNEAGNQLDDMSDSERARVTGELVTFWSSARDHIHSLSPQMAVSVTVREQGYETELAFIELSDVATFNFYCSRFALDLKIQSDPEKIRGYIDQMLTLANGKPLVLQELGCHGGFEDKPTVTAATLDLQKHFFDVVFAELKARPLFRAAVVFQLVDWDPDLYDDFYGTLLRDEGIPESFIEQFGESLTTVGLLRFADGSARPAWNSFIEAL